MSSSTVLTLLGKNFRKEKIIKLYLILWFISIGITSQNGDVPFHLKVVWDTYRY